jgi:hypothetical protein
MELAEDDEEILFYSDSRANWSVKYQFSQSQESLTLNMVR